MMRAIMDAPLPFFTLPLIETGRTMTASSASGLSLGDVVYLSDGHTSFQITGEPRLGTYCVTDTTKTHPPARNRHERRGGRRHK